MEKCFYYHTGYVEIELVNRVNLAGRSAIDDFLGMVENIKHEIDDETKRIATVLPAGCILYEWETTLELHYGALILHSATQVDLKDGYDRSALDGLCQILKFANYAAA